MSGAAPGRHRDTARGRTSWWWIGLVGAATALVVLANRDELPAAWGALRSAHAGWLIVLVALVVVERLDTGVRHLAAQRALDLRPAPAEVLVTAQSAHLLNLVTKSGGLAGLVAFVRARRPGTSRGAIVAAYLLVTVLDQLAFAVMLAFCLVLVAFVGRLSTAALVAAAVFAGYVGVVVAVVVAVTRSQQAIRSLYRLPARVRAGARRLLTGRSTDSTVDDSRADELWEAVRIIRGCPTRAARTGLACLGIDVVLTGELWATLMALGVHPGLLTPVMAYVISTLFGIVGLVPGGLGLVELSLGSVLHAYGISIGIAAAAVVLYRAAEFWTPLAVGVIATQVLAWRRP